MIDAMSRRIGRSRLSDMPASMPHRLRAIPHGRTGRCLPRALQLSVSDIPIERSRSRNQVLQLLASSLPDRDATRPENQLGSFRFKDGDSGDYCTAAARKPILFLADRNNL